MWVLEGESRLEEPGKREIARELRLLFEGKIELLLLAREEIEGASRTRAVQFIQAAPSPHGSTVTVEASFVEVPGEEPTLFSLRAPASRSEATRLFSEVMKSGTLTIDERWRRVVSDEGRRGSSVRGIILTVLGAALVVGASFAARASGASPLDGALSGLCALAALAGMVWMQPRMFDRLTPGLIRAAGRALGMPVRVGHRYQLEVIDPATRSEGKLTLLELVSLGGIVLSILVMGVWLAAIGGLWFLLRAALGFDQ